MGPVSFGAIEQINERLAAIAREQPDLAETARIYGAVLALLATEETAANPLRQTPREIKEHLEKGIPLLDSLDLEVDAGAVVTLLLRLAAAAEHAGAKVSAEAFRKLIDDAGGTETAIQLFLEQWDDVFRAELERKGMDPALCRLLVQCAFYPVLRSMEQQVRPDELSASWARGTCYLCGAAPLLGELQANDQEKHLRCGFCGSDWRVKRIACPNCGSEDHRSLRLLLKDGDPHKPRVEACDQCKTYLKVIPAFSPSPALMLQVEDLATLQLDNVARQHGYHRAGTV